MPQSHLLGKVGTSNIRCPRTASPLGARARELVRRGADRVCRSTFPLGSARERRQFVQQYEDCSSIPSMMGTLKVSTQTVLRDWKFARAWLLQELSNAQ